ncbi:AtpZ/AtpI family protein [Desulfofundulus salinus]|uniref:AtpZ/AtpI family protein n=1 Tax=Desulfofundulus salinus TaxID=2419843 RepID=A0A494WR33_9FIRM|nr:AtpZ/AtpI family protein [Desulfofundulus salinum]RKO65628.1 AtpZ/AtpI family protein [Desulfofundulus salinum]
MGERRVGGRVLAALALTTTIGMEMAIMVTAGFYTGRWLDYQLHTGPWLMTAGILLGTAAGIWGVVQTVSRFFKDWG